MQKFNETNTFLNPVLVGFTEIGKSIACTAANECNVSIYLFNCWPEKDPEELIIIPKISDNHNAIYHASALVSAMINGGVCLLHEADQMDEKCWVCLASLMDNRRYVESIVAGIKITADPEFRIVVTMNDDRSLINLPDFILSRLKPVIPINSQNY